MAPIYTSYTEKLKTLLRKYRNGRLTLPDYQRDFVWSLRQQRKLVTSIRLGKPIPSILLRELEDDTMTLEDGQQRLTTLGLYIDNTFDLDGVYFRDLSDHDQQRVLSYDVVVIKYSGVTDEEARQIFNDFQNGKPLTFGERIYTSRSPIVDYAMRKFLTPGIDLYHRLAKITGEGRTPKGRRGADMARAFAMCAGVAFGIDHLSRKWDDAEILLHKDIDEGALDAKFERYAQVLERVNELEPVLTKTRRSQYWDPGNFMGYVLFTLMIHGTPEGADFNLPHSLDELCEVWAQHIAAVHREPKLLEDVLHRDLSAARSWKRARWANGVRRLFKPDDNTVLEDMGEDDDVFE